jgi:hypothetical protein
LPVGGGPASASEPVVTGLLEVYGVALASPSATSYFAADVGADRVVVTGSTPATLVTVLAEVVSPAGLLVTRSGDLLVVEASLPIRGENGAPPASSGYLIRLSGL